MLMDLLTLVGRGGVQRPADLAAALGVSTGLLEQMLVDLTRMGYLARVGDECGPAACARCSAGCTSAAGAGSPMWMLTASGVRVLDQARKR